MDVTDPLLIFGYSFIQMGKHKTLSVFGKYIQAVSLHVLTHSSLFLLGFERDELTFVFLSPCLKTYSKFPNALRLIHTEMLFVTMCFSIMKPNQRCSGFIWLK